MHLPSFVQEIDAELAALPRTHVAEEMRNAAVAILRRHGLVRPDAGGWYAAVR